MTVSYDDLHRQLVELEQSLKSQVDALEHAVREDGVGYGNHMADAGTEVFEQARDVSLARQLQRSYADTQRALQKFEDGTYGICESCGVIIETPRLEVLPAARYCMRCQSRLEGQR